MKNKKSVGLVAGGTCTRTHVGKHNGVCALFSAANLYPYACGETEQTFGSSSAATPVPVRMWGNIPSVPSPNTFKTCTRTHVGKHLLDGVPFYSHNLYPYACGETHPHSGIFFIPIPCTRTHVGKH